jgi:hypothetical protein
MTGLEGDDPAQAALLAEGLHPDPFGFLGPHGEYVRT